MGYFMLRRGYFMLRRGLTTHIGNLLSKKRKFTTSNIKTLTPTYLSISHVKVSSFTAIQPRRPAEHCIQTAQKALETKWDEAWLLF